MVTTKFTLPISPSYVSHWGLWEAVRELYQNALDEKARTGCQASLTYDVGGVLRVSTDQGSLSPSSLILGNTTKADDPDQRGKFGEGYKLALLVLCRLGYTVVIKNGDFTWTPKIEHSEEFDSEVLNIYVDRTEVGDPDEQMDGVKFIINTITDDEWTAIQANINPIKTYDAILDENHQIGRIYVGGLYVCTMKEFKKGYAFAPGSLPLDRDRGMVSDFDLSLLTSKLHAERESDEGLDLLEAEAPDVRYVQSHARVSSALVVRQAAAFTAKHGADAVPVTTQAEVERAQAAGVRWVLVKQTVRGLLGLVRSWFIPSVKTPVERLRDLRKQYQYNLPSAALVELDDIIRAMSPAPVSPPA